MYYYLFGLPVEGAVAIPFSFAAITGASQHLTRVKAEYSSKMFTKTMILFSREAGIAVSFGLYHGWEDGTYQPKTGTLCAFKAYPDWPHACYNYDYQLFLPLINAAAAAAAAGE